jgi:hypothetical protein
MQQSPGLALAYPVKIISKISTTPTELRNKAQGCHVNRRGYPGLDCPKKFFYPNGVADLVTVINYHTNNPLTYAIPLG